MKIIEACDSHAFMSSRWEKCGQMPRRPLDAPRNPVQGCELDEHPAEPRVCLAGGLKKRKCSRRLEEARLRNQQWSFISALLTYWTKYPTRSV